MKQYFASLPTEELLSELDVKRKRFKLYCDNTGLTARWRKSVDMYFGKAVVGQKTQDVMSVGEDGELKAFGVNNYRNLIKHTLALTTTQKPSFDCRAINSDLASLHQARMGNKILDYYMNEKKVSRTCKLAAEISLVCRTSYHYTPWEPSLGRPINTEIVLDEQNQPMINEQGEPLRRVKFEGDFTNSALCPWRVIYDFKVREWEKNKWIIVETLENKWDLASRYPKVRDEILNYSIEEEDRFTEFELQLDEMDDEHGDDLITVRHFFHLKSDAMPNGRYVRYIGDSIALYDGWYPYRDRLPVQRIASSEAFESCSGYTDFDDVLVLQTVVNTLYSIAFSNQAAFGVQMIWIPEGANVTLNQMKGLAFIKGGLPGSEPRAINLTQTPAEIFKNIQMIETSQEKLSGVNSVVRGEPQANLKSGQALARMQAMAIQFASNFQQAWADLLSDSGTFILHGLQDFAKNERLFSISGKNNKAAMLSFTGDKIKSIDRAIVDLGNPIARTYAGRQDLADSWLEKGLISSKEEYMQIVETGNVDSILEGPQLAIELIRKENEDLIEGKKVVAMVGDKHTTHAQEHLALLSDPELRARANSGDELANNVVQNILMHIEEHKSLASSQDPFFFVISGEQPPPPQMNSANNPQMGAPPTDPTQMQMPEPPPVPPLDPMAGDNQDQLI